MRRRGFTIMEALIASTAVLILGAMLQFSFTLLRLPQTQRTECQANLRQISLAIKQYMADNGEVFPIVRGSTDAYGWAGSIRPYIQDIQVFQCPTENTWAHDYDGPRSRKYVDYFYNANLSGQYEAALQYFANIILLGDASTGDASRHANGDEKATRTQKIIDFDDKPVGAATRHLDGANYAFADGHVKWLKGTDAITAPAILQSPHYTGPTLAIQ